MLIFEKYGYIGLILQRGIRGQSLKFKFTDISNYQSSNSAESSALWTNSQHINKYSYHINKYSHHQLT